MIGTYYDSAHVANKTLYSEGSYDGYIAKLTLEGKLVWIKTIHGKDDNRLGTISIYKDTLLLTGYNYSVTNAEVFYDNHPVKNGSFILKLSSDGNLLSEYILDVKHMAIATFLTYDKNNELCGIISSHSGDTLAEDTKIYPINGISAVKFSSSMKVKWIQSLESVSDYGNKLNLKINKRNELIVAIQNQGHSDFEGSLYSLSPDGKKNWKKTCTGILGESLCIDEQNNIYLSGISNIFFYGYDYLLQKFSPAGDTLLNQDIHFPAMSMCMDKENNLYLLGTPDSVPLRFGNFTVSDRSRLFLVKYGNGIDLTTSAIGIHAKNSFSVYPNPFHSEIRIHVSTKQMIEVVDLKGQTVYRQNVNAGNDLLMLSFLPKGMYFLKAENEIRKIVSY